MLSKWAVEKLEAVNDCERVLLRDPLRLLPETDGLIHKFALENGFTVLVASTNLVFRELYEKAVADGGVTKLLLIDRTPLRRRSPQTVMRAPPLFYPDFLDGVALRARIELSLRQFLVEMTGDPNWPADADETYYARLIVQYLPAVLQSHRNLRTADASRFSDSDFRTIVAYSALNVADSAFKELDAKAYWRIGLLAHEALAELGRLAPDIITPIIEKLRKAPAPFCWFAEHDAELVLKAFYLSLILSQHLEHWSLVLANIDPALKPLSSIEPDILKDAAPKLISLDPNQASRDMQAVEDSLSKDDLQMLLLDQLKLTQPAGYAGLLRKEQFSSLFRSLALLLALRDLIVLPTPAKDQAEIAKLLVANDENATRTFADSRSSTPWTRLKEAHFISSSILALKAELDSVVKRFKVAKPEQLSYGLFLEAWNVKKINRLEYLVSALERLVHSADFLPRSESELPSVFANAVADIRQHVRTLSDEITQRLDDLNALFEAMIAVQYPGWLTQEGEVLLTSQFIGRCLKPHWDPQTEKGVIFIFDGMRYDIWDEFLKPLFEERMELIQEYLGSSLLPSETHLSRKAISAGTYPDEFDASSGEDVLLKAALGREMGYAVNVEVIVPDGMGTGETVRYRAGNLDVFIFEVCDKELHKIQIKTLPDGRQVPSRPLAFIYQQHLKNIIDNEVLAIVRGLLPGTKVFVTADHGFGRVGREKLWLEATWLNQPEDCVYRNAWLRQSIGDLHVPEKVRTNVIEFPASALRMPAHQGVSDKKGSGKWTKDFASIIFPRTGYSFSRPNAHFNPDAYSHGGISIQEMVIPMAVLRIREKDEGWIILEEISGPDEVVESQEVTFNLRLSRSPAARKAEGEIRVDVQAAYAATLETNPLETQVVYLGATPAEVAFIFTPDLADATDDDRKQGFMERLLTLTAIYHVDRRTFRKSVSHPFVLRMNPEQVVRRVPAHLGKILGLTPKTVR
jgi:hypothetical protein